ncbi:MAG: Rne/Rng family ribonuclease [Pseudomonadota bacterium]
MPNELIVNLTLGETRVARLENGVVAELFIERARDHSVVGNIYKGKVSRVLPGMQAAFIDIGLERTAFVHAADIAKDVMQLDEEEKAEISEVLEEGIIEETEDALIEEKKNKRKKTKKSIQGLLQEGTDILVQVEKEPFGTKGARLTSHLSLPGRYLVFMPTVDHIGVSRRIEDSSERDRLKKLIKELHQGSGGYIVRTVAEGVTETELKADIDYLNELWRTIEKKAKPAKSPTLIHEELDVLSRVIRDLFTADVDRVVVDSSIAKEKVKDFISDFLPEAIERVELYQGNEPIFDAFGIEVEITRALGQKVWLKSGGYIIIEQTEALTAIDVNTGRFVGRRNVEDTILKTNLEAVKEIVYQLRLRNIGGIIILDFIDMEKPANRQKVFGTLKEALKSDRARTTITKLSELGLVEMTRARSREDLRRLLSNACPYCEGKGYLKSPTTVCYEIFREIQREANYLKSKKLTVVCHPSIAGLLYDEERAQLEALEKEHKKRISIKSMNDYHLEQFDINE